VAVCLTETRTHPTTRAAQLLLSRGSDPEVRNKWDKRPREMGKSASRIDMGTIVVLVLAFAFIAFRFYKSMEELTGTEL
jgi:hypothetical protein